MIDPGGHDPRIRLMQGNEACAEAAILAGCRFYAGYPISPSSEIAEIMAARLPQVGGWFIQMEDEIAGMAAIIGASLVGVKAMTATSGPGFSLMQENLGYAAMAEVPVVVVDVMRVGPSTGMPTSPSQGDVMQARWGTHGDHPVVALAPSSVNEVFTTTVEAFNISEELRVPVILLMDEVIGHMREKVRLPRRDEVAVSTRKKPQTAPGAFRPYEADEDGVPPMAGFGDGYRLHVTGLYHDEWGFPTGQPAAAEKLIRRLHAKLERAEERITFVHPEATDDAEVLVVAYGSSARAALRAVRLARERGVRAGLLRLTTLWPFPAAAVRAAAAAASQVIVPEMNMGQIVGEVERAIRGRAEVRSLGKVNGELFRPEEILAVVEGAVMTGRPVGG